MLFFHSSSPRKCSIWPRAVLLSFLVVCWGCGTGGRAKQSVLRLATTTSTRDSGLLDMLLPPFEQKHQVRVTVIATGTGKALKLGELGDVDVLFVHARQAEDEFMAAQHGIRREDVMYNTFELLGPEDDPAEIRGLAAPAGLQKLSARGATFISRGDDSGTHKRELLLWQAGGTRPVWDSYRESGQGMGATLTIADEMSAYVLTDRATYLQFREKIDLVPLAVQSEALHNPYGVIVVNPTKHAAVLGSLANALVDYLIAPAVQQQIADYQLHGETLFVPLRLSPQD